MLKNPTEFRERFLRWKKGELVYENGLALPAYEDGKLSPADAGMIKSKLAIASHFGNPTARRMTNYDGRDYTWPGEYEYDNGIGEPKRGNVYVGSYDNLVTPQIQDNGKTLEFVNDVWNPKNDHRSYMQSLKFNNVRDAIIFGENYKKYAPMMNRYEDGLTPLKKSGVNTNLATYDPEEDLYKSRYTLPEVTVTGTNKRPHTHAPIHYSKNAYKVLTGDLLGAMTTGMNVLSPSLWYGAVRDADGIQDGFNKLMRGNSGFVTEDYAKDHPYISTGVNLVGDAAVLGSSAITNKLRNLNFYKSYKISKAIDKGVILNPVISAYNRNPAVKDLGTLWDYQSYLNLVFPNSKIKDVQFHIGPKGIEQLKVSDGTVWNINPNAKGIYVSPDKSYPQAIRKHTTIRLENTPMSKNIIRNLHPKSWDKVNELYTEIYPTIIDTQNPLYTRGDWTWGMSKKKYDSVFKDYDAIVNFGPKWYQNVNSMPETILPSSNQTLILGSNKDLLGFKSYMLNK